MRQWLGSIVFTAYLFASVAVWGTLVLFTFVFPHRVSYRGAHGWSHVVLRMLRWLCRLDYVVEGREHLPAEPSVVLIDRKSVV